MAPMEVDGGNAGLAQSRHYAEDDDQPVVTRILTREAATEADNSTTTTTKKTKTTTDPSELGAKRNKTRKSPRDRDAIANPSTATTSATEGTKNTKNDDELDQQHTVTWYLRYMIGLSAPGKEKSMEKAADHIREQIELMEKKWREHAAKEEKAAKTVTSGPGLAGGRTWASVAAMGQATPMVIPARSVREVVVDAETTPDLANRTPLETVQAVNQAIGRTDAVAARRLQSGKVVVTFRDETTARGDREWVQKAFGADAQAARREFTLLAKGLPAEKLRAEQRITEALRAQNTTAITKVKPELPRDSQGVRAAAIIHVDDIDEARRLCCDGVIWDAQIFHCEPYHADARPKRCFRCHEFGHISRFCNKKARCGHCAGTAHEEGEATCPVVITKGQRKCVNCGGAHPAWARECPEAERQRCRAAEAYQHRPTQFEVLGRQQGQPATSGNSRLSGGQAREEITDDEGYQLHTNKRPRQRGPGRPSEAEQLQTPEPGSRDIVMMFRRQGAVSANDAAPLPTAQ